MGEVLLAIMSQLSELRTDLQARFSDTTGRFLDDATANRYINVANREFVLKTEALIREYGWPLVTNQFLYDMPSDIVKPATLMWMKNSRHPLTYQGTTYFADHGGFDLTDSGPAHTYTFYDKKIRLWPSPISTSETTTMNDSGGINTTDTSVILTDGSNLRDEGWIQIESELILYYARSGNTLSQLVRGVGGTTAATHSDTTAVHQVDLHMWYLHLDSTLTADADIPAIQPQYHDTLVLGALYHALRSDGRDREASVIQQEWGTSIAYAKGDIQKNQTSNFLNIHLHHGYS